MSLSSGDPVRPSNDAFEAAFVHGYRTWTHLYDIVKERGHRQVILQALRTIDNAVPLYPKLPVDLSTSSPVQGNALAKGTITYDVLQGDGGSWPLKHDVRLQVALPSPVRVYCTLDDSAGLGRSELRHRVHRQGAMLFAAWAYVLSARWAELLPSSAVMSYTSSEDPSLARAEDNSDDEVIPDLGDIDDNACQWWQHVLAAGSGWEARLVMDGQKDMHSPWSVSLHGKWGRERRRAGPRPANAVDGHVASFAEAMAYLQDFTNHHCAYDQSRAALAAALFIPVARHDHRDIYLCEPCFQTEDFHLYEADDTVSNVFTPTTELVDRLILLGCNAFGVKALLCSAFYEPDIFCNLSGPWIQGSFKPMSGCDPATRLSILILRDPDIGFLWKGAYLTGALDTCLAQVSRGLWRVDLTVGDLTGTSMSFAQGGIICNTSASSLSRADECRARYLHQSNLDAPNFAFPPFGSTALGNLDLEVRLLLQELPLSMQPQHITWETTVPTTTTVSLVAAPQRKKTGPMSQPNVEPPRLSDEERTAAEECSKTTTRNAFEWLREAPVVGNRGSAPETSVVVDGCVIWTVEEREIFKHEWLRSLFSVAPADKAVEG